ncbi:MAG: response regulator, partial [Myxococcales bacterium]|nr:response regulator [Myxococcales bacterium]
GPAGSQLALAIADDVELGDVRIVLLDSMLARVGGEAASHRAACRVTKPARQTELYDCIAGVLGGMRASGWTPSDTAAREDRARGARLDARVLLVEDNEVNQMVAVAMLNSFGCSVDVAGDARAALERIERERYDAVLMDCQMPGMNGYQATVEIRRRNARAAGGERLCVIALTANRLEGDRERCLAAGMDDYLGKPFTQRELLEMLTRWLSPRRDATE